MPVRAGIERLLGSRVVEARNQTGGFSPRMAAIVRCADGSRAFVKAVGPELNSRSPALHRSEGQIAAELPSSAPTPPLLATYDDDSWVALVFEAIDGRVPTTPWREPQLSMVIEAITRLSQTLTPCPIADIPTAPDSLHQDLTAYARLAKDPPADLHGWERRNLDLLAALGSDTLATNPLLEGVEPWHVTGLLAGLAGMWAEAMRRPPPPGLPTIRTFQRVQHDAVLPWVRRRTG